MKKTGILFLVLLITSSFAFSAQWVEIKKADEPFTVEVSETVIERTTLDYSVNGYSMDNIVIDGKSYNFFSKLRKESVIEEKGFPRLPRINRSILIPDNGIMGYEVISAEYIEIENIDIAPSKGHFTRDIDPATVPFTFADVYQKDEFYPAELVNLRDPYIMRDFRGVVVELNAFQYNPIQKTLRIYTDVSIEVSKSAPGGVNVMQRNESELRVPAQFDKMYKRHFVNSNLLDYVPLEEDGNMLIISYDGFMDAMEPLVEWKNQRGLPTTMVSVDAIGNTTTQIKNYIQEEYNTNGIVYVLLVGDHPQVTAWSTSPWGGDSDPVYGMLTGSDAYPEVFVGRFSAENEAQVETQVAKTINYEKYPDIGAEWYQHALGIASNQGPGHWGEYDDEHITLILNQLQRNTFTYVDSCYDYWGTQAIINSNLNQQGISAVYYCGHGSSTSWGTTGFNNSSVNNLTNVGTLPHIISVACNNGTFSNTTCFAEAWLRATHNTTGEPTGAVAAYMSFISQSWNPPMDAEDEAVDLMTANEMYTFGGVCFNGSNLMVDLNGGQGANEAEAWTIFGDPSLLLRTEAPSELNVTHDAGMNIGVATFDVNVEGMEGATVCGMNDEIYAVGVTDASGDVTLTFNPVANLPGSFTLTVTGLNAVPYITEVNLIAPNGPFVVFNALEIDDASGNDNGLLNPGENAYLDITVENVGTLDASNVDVTIDSESDYITIIDDNEMYGNIGSGTTSMILNGFQVELAGTTPAGYEIDFTLIATDGIDTWESSFTIDAIPDVVVTLDPSGLPIQIPGSGGSFDFVIGAENLGSMTAICDIWTMVTLPDGSSYGPIINVNKTMSGGFTIDRDRTQSVPTNAPSGDYTYHAYIGDYPDGIYAQDEFDFEKLATDNNGEFVSNWNNFGESFNDFDENAASMLPKQYSLQNAYPNPFNPQTTINFSLPEASEVSLTVYNLAGQIVSALHNGLTPAGFHTFTWNAEGMSSGVYFYHLQAGEFNDVKKCVLMK